MTPTANPKLFRFPREMQVRSLETIEAMINDGWVTAKINKKRPFITVGE